METDFASAQNVIIVFINYRLGAFGLFAHEELRTEDYPSTGGALALLDQITAIEWVIFKKSVPSICYFFSKL